MRDFARVLARRLGELHGQIGGEISVLRISGALYLYGSSVQARGHHVGGDRCERLAQQGVDQGFQGGSMFYAIKGRQFTAARAVPRGSLRRYFRRGSRDGGDTALQAGRVFD
jgi:hypothetical protein